MSRTSSGHDVAPFLENSFQSLVYRIRSDCKLVQQELVPVSADRYTLALMHEMYFEEAVEHLLSLGHETLTIKLGLRNTELLLRELGNPERSFPAVQIAGTNGKGSTAAFLNAICRSAGIKSGLYTSPHLHSITERIEIGGTEISGKEFAQHATEVRTAAELLLKHRKIEALPTFFEQVTAIALVSFRQAQIDHAILETGLGGRLDSTTAANAQVCAITQIAFDHEEYLGNTLEEIAAEKAAIIRPGMKVVVAPQEPEVLDVILERCEEVGVEPLLSGINFKVDQMSADGRCQVTFETSTRRYEKIWLGLRGRHQIENAALAIQLAEILRTQRFSISQSAIVTGLESARHPGRLELISARPAFLLDGAHNVAGARTLQSFLEEFARRPLTMIFGAMRDKRIEEIAEVLFPLADQLILTPIQNPRAASIEKLNQIAKKFDRGQNKNVATSLEAINLATQTTASSGMICVTGSLYLIGETRSLIINRSESVSA
ncbi:MAG TPA: folylpolyglutamate synthase/dihydrofolate synthase family protein [Pyrinomonadaceae bacterium]|nr:folylpolyglutamate synthase/dihydrofolate synthase family protein [Pyrinomonadaceae bacterium]